MFLKEDEISPLISESGSRGKSHGSINNPNWVICRLPLEKWGSRKKKGGGERGAVETEKVERAISNPLKVRVGVKESGVPDSESLSPF